MRMRGRSGISAAVALLSAACFTFQVQRGFVFSWSPQSRLRPRLRASPERAVNVVDVAPLFHRIAAALPEATLVQVGACDGDFGEEASSNDPVQRLLLKEPSMRAVLVEANPVVFEILRDNVKRRFASRVQPLNVAVTTHNCSHVGFYVVSPKFAQDHPRKAFHWARFQLGSMDREHVAKHYAHVGMSEDEFVEYIQEISVPARTPAQLLAQANLTPSDVSMLAVDAEGFDDVIVRAFLELPGFDPRLITFEVAHLDAADQDDMLLLLAERGYTAGWARTDMSEEGKGDIVAWK